MSRILMPRRDLVLPRRFRQRQGGFIMNPFAYGGGGGGGTAWTTTATLVLNTNSNTWGGYTLRNVIPTTALANGYKIRLTLTAPPGNSVVIADAYLQTKAGSGDPYDFSGTPIRVTFSGANGTTIAAGGTVVTDEVVIGVSTSVGIVFTAAFTTAAAMRMLNGATGWAGYFTVGNRAHIVNEGTISSLGANTSALVSKVEVWT